MMFSLDAGKIFKGSKTSPAMAKILTIRQLTRDLFAEDNVLVTAVFYTAAETSSLSMLRSIHSFIHLFVSGNKGP